MVSRKLDKNTFSLNFYPAGCASVLSPVLSGDVETEAEALSVTTDLKNNIFFELNVTFLFKKLIKLDTKSFL